MRRRSARHARVTLAVGVSRLSSEAVRDRLHSRDTARDFWATIAEIRRRVYPVLRRSEMPDFARCRQLSAKRAQIGAAIESGRCFSENIIRRCHS